MRLSIALLAAILFLLGLNSLGAVTIKGNWLGWMEILDTAAFIFEPLLPVVPIPWKKD